ncbi:hypothetical protein A7C99_2032 [Trichophyton rubrum]|uniref:Uncharacterized protein n=1 Tax=Trichophyton rubrum TaxID=5551 RepID=A0A178F397_TRIRU|nr:hypothetical protein A7C99_2032 [Trichophyton rubrum]
MSSALLLSPLEETERRSSGRGVKGGQITPFQRLLCTAQEVLQRPPDASQSLRDTLAFVKVFGKVCRYGSSEAATWASRWEQQAAAAAAAAGQTLASEISVETGLKEPVVFVHGNLHRPEEASPFSGGREEEEKGAQVAAGLFSLLLPFVLPACLCAQCFALLAVFCEPYGTFIRCRWRTGIAMSPARVEI